VEGTELHSWDCSKWEETVYLSTLQYGRQGLLAAKDVEC
jgi:hypothetical protein